MKCPDCDFVTTSSAGLSSHRRSAHRSLRGANAKAIEVTLTELRRMGRLEKVDSARVQALKSMAAALDANPFNSQMWREYREAIEGLCADDSGSDASLDQLLDDLSPPVRHPPPA